MSDASVAPPIQIKAPSPGKYRWIIMWLLFAAMVINYVDRQMIGFLKPTLSAEFGWSETDYADIVFWFQASYAVAYLLWGRIMDRIGARWGLGIAFGIWQIGHIMHGAARDLSHFMMARMVLGVGEAGGFPGGIKAVAEWFPKKERAFATGLFNAGTNIGAIVTPLIVPGLVLAFGWQMAFVITGALGLIWLPIWLLVYRKPREQKKLSAAELAYIEQDPADVVEKVKWTKLLTVKETWAYALGKFLIDPIWWMFLFWQGPQDHHVDLRPVRRAGGLRGRSVKPLGRGRHHRTGDGRAPGLFGQSLCAAGRCLPPLGGGVGRRHRRHAGRHRRHGHGQIRRLRPREDRHLYAHLHRGGLGLSDRASGHSPDHAEIRTGQGLTND